MTAGFIKILSIIQICIFAATTYNYSRLSHKYILPSAKPQSDITSFRRVMAQPTTILELISNIKNVLDFNLALRPDFFSDANLLKMLGAHNILKAFDSNSSENITVTSSDFGNLTKEEKFDDYVLPGITFSATRRRNPNGKITSTFTIIFRVNGPSFEYMVQKFGKLWKLDNVNSFHGPPLPATSQHGNDRIIYLFDSPSVRKKLGMQFSPNATLSNLNFSEEQR
jgi:hypothetical protein